MTTLVYKDTKYPFPLMKLKQSSTAILRSSAVTLCTTRLYI